MPLKEFLTTLEKMKEVHQKKSEDYADVNNPLSNFDVSEYGLRLFMAERDKCFAWPIFTKLARLATLLNSGNAPNNESIEDSFVDIANYVIIWKCDYIQRQKIKNQSNIISYLCDQCGKSRLSTITLHVLEPTEASYCFCSELCRNEFLAKGTY